jgi:nucleoside-diphosphate-sugar epimerase
LCPPEVNGNEMFCASLESGEDLSDWMKSVDAVVHAAGPPSVAASFRNPVLFAEAHVLGTARVLEAALSCAVKRLVYVSSADVYGQPLTNPVGESEFIRPLSPYAGMKVAAETMLLAGARYAGIELVILRPFSVYGPGMSDYSLITSLISQSLCGSAIEIHSPEVVRDYVYVDDVAKAVGKSLARHASKDALLLNIGSGRGTSALELARKIQSIARVEKLLVRRTNSDRPVGLDISHLVADIRLAKRQLGWAPEVALESGLALTIKSRCAPPA